MTTALAEKNLLVRDAEGYWYSIPAALKPQFDAINEECTNADFASNEWQSAQDQLTAEFGEYQQ